MKLKKLSASMLALCLIGLSVTSCKKQAAQQQGSGAAEVETYTVQTGVANLSQDYPATIKGKTDIEIRPQISGFITKVCVDEGQRVVKGQTLFLIDQVELQAAVQSAKAQVAVAKSQVATTQLTVKNKKALLDKKIISDYDYQTSYLAWQSAKSQLNQAQQALVQAEKNLSYAYVKAPCNGVVGSIPNREGSLASPSGQALTTVSDNDQVYAYFSLNEKDIIRLTEGGQRSLQAAIAALPPVKLKLSDGTVYAYTGRVSTVSGVLDQSTGSATVRALFPNASGMLRSGSTGSVLLPVTMGNVILVPQKATYELQDMKYVYVLNDSSKAVATPIKVLDENDGVNYVVTSGLKVGDVVPVEGVGTQVKDGVLVKPTTPAQRAKQAAAVAAAAQKK